jgi:hypothetical protein
VFAPALKFLALFARTQGHQGRLAYHDPRWRRDRAPLLDHMAAVVDHIDAFSRGGLHDPANFVTACNKCNARKGNVVAGTFRDAAPARKVRGKYGEPEHWDGFSTLFVVLARADEGLSISEKGWLRALQGP